MIVRCSKCVLPTTRPDTAFVDGVCSACRNAEKAKSTDWASRRELLEEILDRYHGEVLVPVSGGRDSTYQVVTLLEMGAHVRGINATTCHLTPRGRANLDNLKRLCTVIEYSPNARVNATLNRLALKHCGDISWPEHAKIWSVTFRIAADLGYGLVMYGECPQQTWGGPLGHEDALVMDHRWVSEHGGYLGWRPQDWIGMEGITERDMADYTMPTPERAKGVKAYFLGQFLGWSSRHNAEVSARHGFTYELACPGTWLDASNQDNAQTGVHDYFATLKYQLGRVAQEISADIRDGRITREEAMEIVRERDGAYPHCYAGVPLADMLDRIGMTRTEFDAICDQYTNWSLFDGYRADGSPRPKEFA